MTMKPDPADVYESMSPIGDPLPKYPNVHVQLVGEDGNAYFILGRCKSASRGKLTQTEWEAFQAQAAAGDYDHLLATCMEWFDCA